MGDLDVSIPAHRLFLIRHGETVDNVAGLYAGVRDSALTSHGYQQAVRLGKYFADARVVFTDVFSSDLSRAFKTAEAIRTSQLASLSNALPICALQTQALTDLRERYFGYYEGKLFHAPRSSSDRDEPGFQDMEPMEAMTARANAFLDGHLFPLINDADQSRCIAVVSHGMLLSTLWRCIYRRQMAQTIILDPKLSEVMTVSSLEHIGSWGNTAFLEVELYRLPEAFKAAATVLNEDNPTLTEMDPQDSRYIPRENSCTNELANAPDCSKGHKMNAVSQFSIIVKVIHSREHLRGLKRTGGGVGSSKFDEGQRSIESFFKTNKAG